MRLRSVVALLVVTSALMTGCEWRGVNSLKLPGTAGGGPGSYSIQVQLPDAVNIEPNSRVRVNDVTVGNVTRVQLQDRHALLTIRLSGDVDLPANAVASLGQTSLLGSLHVELSAPKGVAPEGRLHEGSLIPLSSAKASPTTEQTLSAMSLLLNGGGLGNIQDITQSLSTAMTGREQDARQLLAQMNEFVGYLNDQTDDIIRATTSLNNVSGQFAAAKPVLEKALQTAPGALETLKQQREHLTDAVTRLGQLSALSADQLDRSKDNLVNELRQLAPVLESFGNAGKAFPHSLSTLATFPWPVETLEKWVRGDYANLTATIDLTLSRIDADFFTGTRWEGKLTELEMQWGRTIGQLPSPYTAGNPLVAPYNWNQGR